MNGYLENDIHKETKEMKIKELLAYGFCVEIISMKEKTVAFIHDRMKKEVSP